MFAVFVKILKFRKNSKTSGVVFCSPISQNLGARAYCIDRERERYSKLGSPELFGALRKGAGF